MCDASTPDSLECNPRCANATCCGKLPSQASDFNHGFVAEPVVFTELRSAARILTGTNSTCRETRHTQAAHYVHMQGTRTLWTPVPSVLPMPSPHASLTQHHHEVPQPQSSPLACPDPLHLDHPGPLPGQLVLLLVADCGSADTGRVRLLHSESQSTSVHSLNHHLYSCGQRFLSQRFQNDIAKVNR